MRDTMEVALVLSVLRMAREARQSAPGLIFHSDRGNQYASGAHRTELEAHGILASMSGCHDNAVVESLFTTLTYELAMTHDWHLQEDSRRATLSDIEAWYNRKRWQ